eukprot:352809-Chlamydomonas_euryale.AAC.2
MQRLTLADKAAAVLVQRHKRLFGDRHAVLRRHGMKQASEELLRTTWRAHGGVQQLSLMATAAPPVGNSSCPRWQQQLPRWQQQVSRWQHARDKTSTRQRGTRSHSTGREEHVHTPPAGRNTFTLHWQGGHSHHQARNQQLWTPHETTQEGEKEQSIIGPDGS